MASLSSLYVSSSSSSPLPPHRNLNSFFRHGSNLPNPTRSSSSSTRRSRSTISLSFRTSYRFSVDHEDEDEEEDQIARDSCFDEAVDLFNRGAYYDCHDVLEILWNGAEDPTRTLIHGILQCAVGLHHLFNRNHKGAMMELGEGLCKLRKMEFRSGPFFTFEREISAVLDFVYQTQIELAAFSIRPVPELMRASFDTLKYYKERFSRGRKVGTLVTDELLLESGLLDYNPAVRLIESSRPNSELAMVCGFASSVKRKSKGRAHALEAAQSSK
ncbi:uncharacterized protein LOC111019851, partial [Momordica charantia]|uniref:Uncharacterized protein LOC111019851 n=1 Tax=Momordica charantia TaxID=3673 RepID=A0A6J1DGF9_MOMCH